MVIFFLAVLPSSTCPFCSNFSKAFLPYPMKALTIKESLELLYTGQWLSARYITADVTKGKGGTVMELPRCRVILKEPGGTHSNSQSGSRETKAQNHHENFTVNVELPNRLTRKIHIPLITHLNSIPII